MFSIQQLQAFDYLLKRITNDSSNALCNKNLKLVVDINGSHWSGDFLSVERHVVRQPYIDDQGDIEFVSFQPTGSNATTVLKAAWDVFLRETTDRPGFHWGNPIRRINSLPLLFDTLSKVIDMADIAEESSPLHPFLLNARSIDGTKSLPFINLNGQKLHLMSIIEISE